MCSQSNLPPSYTKYNFARIQRQVCALGWDESLRLELVRLRILDWITKDCPLCVFINILPVICQIQFDNKPEISHNYTVSRDKVAINFIISCHNMRNG